jgi:hypothetical protein
MPVKFNSSEIGRTGLIQNSGYVQEEFLRELSGTRWRKVVKEMLWNDPVIASMFFAIEMLVRQVTWDVQAASDDIADQENADLVKDCLDDMEQPWKETLAEILTFLPWGWALFEKVFKRRADSTIGWHKWAIRSQESLDRWEFDENGNAVAMVQTAAPDYRAVTIPLEKSILFRTSIRKSNPEGHSLLRSVYRPWYFKTRIENIEGIGTERDLAGLPVLYIPAEYFSTEDTDKLAIKTYCEKVVTGVRNDEQAGILLPAQYDQHGNALWEFKLVSTGGTRQFDTNKIISRYDQRILMTLMADFLLLGHEKVGSFALSSDKTSMFSVALGSWLDSICEVINRGPIPELLRLNGKSFDNPPILTHGDIESVDLTELGEFISKLSGAGITLTPQQLGYTLEQAGLPVPEDEAELAAMIGPKPMEQPGIVKTPSKNGKSVPQAEEVNA